MWTIDELFKAMKTKQNSLDIIELEDDGQYLKIKGGDDKKDEVVRQTDKEIHKDGI